MLSSKNAAPNISRQNIHGLQTRSSKLNTADLSLIAMFTAIICICAWISIPAAVPFSMQTFGIFLTLGTLGGKRGTLAVAAYLFLGMLGLPVFSGFAGGLGYIMGNTGGYILGFLASALVMWGIETIYTTFFDKIRYNTSKKDPNTTCTTAAPKFYKKISAPSSERVSARSSCNIFKIKCSLRWELLLALQMMFGLLVCYSVGTLWFMIMYLNRTGPIGIWTALSWCVFPYLLPDILKMLLALKLCRRLRKIHLELYH